VPYRVLKKCFSCVGGGAPPPLGRREKLATTSTEPRTFLFDLVRWFWEGPFTFYMSHILVLSLDRSSLSLLAAVSYGQEKRRTSSENNEERQWCCCEPNIGGSFLSGNGRFCRVKSAHTITLIAENGLQAINVYRWRTVTVGEKVG
jgi:hypothetical protein